MIETELALAMSARNWADELHRFLADHGGARVRVTAMGPEDLQGESFDVLLIDDICSFLTPRLVETVKSGGRQVIGVYDPAEFADGKDRLLECGVADVVESGAHPDEFLGVIARVAETVSSVAVSAPPAPASPVDGPRHERRRPWVIAVGGPPGGVGATEIAVGVAARLTEARRRVVLVDADDHAPSIAQRLGLPVHPNLRTAIDVMEHRTAPLTTALQAQAGFGVITGLPNLDDWSEVRPTQAADLVTELKAIADHVIVNVGSQVESLGLGGADRYGLTRRVLALSDRVIAVGLPSPVGVARLLAWLAVVDRLVDGRPVDVVINRAPRDQFRRAEIVEEIARTYQASSFGFVPDDAAVRHAAWDGVAVERGRFRKALDRWVDRSFSGIAP